MQAIKSEVKRNAPVLFAVQLDWSVTPFDMAKVPPLAIFNAYTLYTTEANREGPHLVRPAPRLLQRRRFREAGGVLRALRLQDRVGRARDDDRERTRQRLNAARSGIHRAANIKEGPAPTPLSMTSSNASGVFKLLDDDLPAHHRAGRRRRDVAALQQAGRRHARCAGAGREARGARRAGSAATSKASKGASPAPAVLRRDAHAQVDEETLDQTLEILGANTLEITNDSAGDTGVRHLRVKVDKKGSKFASLIDRLSGKKPNPF